ncbi:HupE/UreJ family protein [uncultured Aquimarina sp.]|uniref:HupE/UreJ family protein n=1 Tax=uncultured Aquimarina sp. TaxID=575652 RepID=UPI00260CF439|nr:HupE/UreJ family protein [uncultured Aquimarina sp.]
MSEFKYFFKEGFFHVLDWQAYDHVLFFIVLVIGYSFNNWKRILFLTTLFTLGHTISLFLTSFLVDNVNSDLIEFLIPITILATALFNVFTAKKTSQNDKKGILYVTALFFGIIHGLGFSSYFKMIIDVGEYKVLSILEFGLGIEMSQILVVLIVLLINFIIQTFFRFSKRDWILVVSSIVIGMVIPMIISNKIW